MRIAGLVDREQLRDWAKRRGPGFFLALIVEALVALMLLTLGAPIAHIKPPVPMSVFSISPDKPAPPAEKTESKAEAKPKTVTPPTQPVTKTPPVPTPPVPPSPVPPPPLPPLPRIDFTATTLPSAMPAAPPAPARPKVLYGPAVPASSGSSDTPRVEGQGPHGEPLYAASWYREPYPEELRGYLSTASGPGWALIACRTVPEYRVTDCVKLDEYPEDSHIARSVLAAAWQFKVRPPRLGGAYKYGEWVRIRIDYSDSVASPYARP